MQIKICSRCRQEKFVNEFRKSKGGKDNLRSICKQCDKEYNKKYSVEHKEESKKRSRTWHKNNPRRYKLWPSVKRFRNSEKGKLLLKKCTLRYKYGLTPEQHKEIYVQQNGCCAVCGIIIEYNKIVTDHDHKTGKIRGLLCYKCNHFISAVEDNEFVRKARQYLANNSV